MSSVHPRPNRDSWIVDYLKVVVGLVLALPVGLVAACVVVDDSTSHIEAQHGDVNRTNSVAPTTTVTGTVGLKIPLPGD